MNQKKDKIKMSKPVVFLNIFPKPQVKEQICTKQESFLDITEKQSRLSKKIKSQLLKIGRLKDNQSENSDSLYEPSENISDFEGADEKPHKKLKLQNSNLKIEKNQTDRRKSYKSRLRIRDFQVISREQFQLAKNKPKKQTKVKIMAFDVDESCEIYL